MRILGWNLRRAAGAPNGAGMDRVLVRVPKILDRVRFAGDLDEAAALDCAVAVHMLQIDRFEEIAGTIGRAAGEEIVGHVARRLASAIGRNDLLARIGDDTFALAQIVESPRAVTRTARQMLRVLGETFRLADRDVEISGCVGSAVSPAHGRDAEALLKSAGIALARAKGDGFGSRALFRPEMDRELQERQRVEAALRTAVASDGFALHFQPIRRARDGRLAGFEALLRLPDPEGGFIPPASFVPLAERLELIAPIGEWIIRHACAAAAAWPGQLFVALNLSSVQFQDGLLAQTVRDALDTTGLDAGRLELEITEGLLLSHTEAVLNQLGELKALGVKIVMDDFGTGYSSLGTLWRFPFDRLKIDRAFMRELKDGEDVRLAAAARAILAAAGALGIAVAAEGVETEAQATFLGGIGVDLLQGFVLGRPLERSRLPGVILQDFRPAIRPAEASAPGAMRQGA